MAEQNISVGKLGKPHGIGGAFRFLLHRELKSTKKLPNHFFIDDKGSALPWFIKEIEWLEFNQGFIWFEEITTPEKARLYSGRELFLSPKDVTVLFKKDAGEYDDILGYAAVDEIAGEMGIIVEMIENPGQILCLIKSETKETYVPFVEEFIINVNKQKKQILFSLPDGLLDV
ncbi:MAG: ribosome maturation factor RimM [Chitinophagales bacterium]